MDRKHNPGMPETRFGVNRKFEKNVKTCQTSGHVTERHDKHLLYDKHDIDNQLTFTWLGQNDAGSNFKPAFSIKYTQA